MSQENKKPVKKRPPPQELSGADENKYARRAIRKIKASEVPTRVEEIKKNSITKLEMEWTDETTRNVVLKTITDNVDFESQALLRDAEIVATESGKESNDLPISDGIRKLAELTYITYPGDTPISAIAEMPQFKGKISERMLYYYCNTYDWGDKRRQYARKLQAQLEKKIATAQIRSRIDQLQKLDALYTVLNESIPKVEPVSLEGVANAMIRLVKISEELRDRVCASIVTPDAPSKEVTPVQPVVTREEARLIAATLVKFRKEGNASTVSTEYKEEQLDV